MLTFLLQKHATLGDYDWDVAIDVALAVLVEQRYRYIRVRYALDEGYSKYALCCFCWKDVSDCVQQEGVETPQAHPDKTQPYQVRLFRHSYGRRSSALEWLRWVRKGALPFCSSSFFTARLLKVFHHEVKSRLADTGSFAGTGVG